MTYTTANIVCFILVAVYGLLDHWASFGKYTEFQEGIFNLLFTFCLGYFFCNIFK